MNPQPASSEFRFEKHRAEAVVTLVTNENVKGCFFTAAGNARRDGAERIGDLLNSEKGAVANLIRESKTFQIPSIMQVNKAIGMVALNDALYDLVQKKLVMPDEALSKAVDKNGFEALLKRGNFAYGPPPDKVKLTPAT